MREQQIQKAIIKYLEKQGAYVVKIITASKSGVPDIIACYQGRLLGLEVKTKTGRVAPLQRYHLDLVEKAGGVAAVVRSVADVEQVLDERAGRGKI